MSAYLFVSMLKTPMSVLFSNLQRVAMAGFEGAASAALLLALPSAPAAGRLSSAAAQLGSSSSSTPSLLHSLANSFLPPPSLFLLGQAALAFAKSRQGACARGGAGCRRLSSVTIKVPAQGRSVRRTGRPSAPH